MSKNLEKINTLQIRKGHLLNDIKALNEMLSRSKQELSDVNEEIYALQNSEC